VKIPGWDHTTWDRESRAEGEAGKTYHKRRDDSEICDEDRAGEDTKGGRAGDRSEPKIRGCEGAKSGDWRDAGSEHEGDKYLRGPDRSDETEDLAGVQGSDDGEVQAGRPYLGRPVRFELTRGRDQEFEERDQGAEEDEEEGEWGYGGREAECNEWYEAGPDAEWVRDCEVRGFEGVRLEWSAIG